MATIIYSQGRADVSVPSGEKIAIFSNSPLKLYQQTGYPNMPSTWDLITETAAGENYTSSAFSAATTVRVEASAADAFYEVGAAPVVSEPQTDITAADATFTITGLSAAQGGYVRSVGGVSSTSGNAGGAAENYGGTPGATGAGGAVNNIASAGGATSGTGGAVNNTAGAGTNGNANGGSVINTVGAKNGSGLDGHIINRGLVAETQGAPTAKTVAVTVTIAELITKIVTGTHTAGATQAYTLPTGTDADAGVQLSADDSFDWYLINLSAAALDTITLTANTAHTIVGNPIVQSAHSSTGGIYGNSAKFRTRKTAANTFVTYRIC